MNLPRPEYPRPQLVREDWTNLNGEWEFEIDHARSGQERKLYQQRSLADRILVPFCPESAASRIGYRDFMNCVWYRRSVEVPEEWKDRRVLLHFGAVDYHAQVYINGQWAGEHVGGYTPFSIDVTAYLQESHNDITVCAEDDTRSNSQPSGKQSERYDSYGCYYTRTTGIWQTVWMECVDPAHIEAVRYDTDITACRVVIRTQASSAAMGCELTASVFFDGRLMGKACTRMESGEAFVTIDLAEKHLWEAGKGNLYDVQLQLMQGGVVRDQARSYFGLRSVCLKNGAFCLNGNVLFGRWVLDQGFYPEGIYTAPNEEALKQDISCAMKLGFNGARLHEKVFEPRFLYWADRLGYLVWSEYPNWGLDVTEPQQLIHILPEWMEAVKRDWAHPCVIGWCPLNETWDVNGKRQCDAVLKTIYQATKMLDPTRPVIDTSGNFHVMTDIFDVHDYEQDPDRFRSYYEHAEDGVILDQIERNPQLAGRQKAKGEPFFVSEYGGIRISEKAEGWGYGKAPESDEEMMDRYRRLTEALLDNEACMGFCYTQLYDVEQEVNGLMTYDRQFKLDPQSFYAINTKPAAIEQKAGQ